MYDVQNEEDIEVLGELIGCIESGKKRIEGCLEACEEKLNEYSSYKSCIAKCRDAGRNIINTCTLNTNDNINKVRECIKKSGCGSFPYTSLECIGPSVENIRDCYRLECSNIDCRREGDAIFETIRTPDLHLKTLFEKEKSQIPFAFSERKKLWVAVVILLISSIVSIYIYYRKNNKKK